MPVPSHQLRQWSIAFHKHGQRGQPVSLEAGAVTIGRDAACTIRLPDASVSRRHAELRATADGVALQDTSSTGLKVNGVPRRQATLQPGDIVDLGIYRFEVLASAGAAPEEAPQYTFHTAAALEQTMARHQPLPAEPLDRQLTMLSHVCFWVTEDLAEEQLRPRLLQLLLDGFRVQEVQLYSAGLELQAHVREADAKSSPRLAPYLAERCQTVPEAAMITGEQMRRHQQKVGAYNYLVGPLRQAQEPSAKAPFVLLLRPADWVEFTARDRVLLQAICQLWVRAQGKVQQVQTLRQENAKLKARAPGSAGQLLGSSAALQKLRERVAKVAGTKATVLITGETGSGKEVVAQAVHEHSPRAAGPFVKLNCAAMPDALIESELFGHVKGAFTDAKAHHDGKFVQAHGGTLFLDEIAEMPLTVQAKLLRALETGEVNPIGSEKPRQVDVRIVAATHADLPAMTAARTFREDLYYRLNVATLKVPPLREHPEDIPALAQHFLALFCQENGLAELGFAAPAMQVLQKHAWPGNVRELRNVVQRCAIEAEGALLTATEVRHHLQP